VALELGAAALLVRQEEVRALEPGADAAPGTGAEGPTAWVDYGGERWPVYATTPELHAMAPPLPADRRVCVLLEWGGARLALACTEARTVPPEGLALHPLPPCMHAPGMPVHALGRVGRRLLPVADLAALARRLGGAGGDDGG
jgi:hypothetical protein